MSIASYSDNDDHYIVIRIIALNTDDAETFKDSWSMSVGSPLPSIYIKTYIDEKLICLKSDLHPLGLV